MLAVQPPAWIDPQLATFLVLAAALVLFVTERIRPDLTALLIPVTLGALGVLTPEKALSGFGNPAVLTVAGMFVLSRALERTGAVAMLGRALAKFGAGGQRRALFALVVLAAVPSAFITNTLVVVVFIPAVLAVSQKLDVAPSRLLLPLAYASILGGCCTVIGTSTTILVDGLLPTFSISTPDGIVHPEGLGFFDPLPFGLVLLLAGTVYLVAAGPVVVPTRRTVTTTRPDLPAEYVTEVRVAPDSPLVGMTVAEAITDRHPDLTVIEIVRGAEILWPGGEGLRLAEGDLVLIRGEAVDVMDMGSSSGAELLPELRGRGIRERDVTLAELVLTRGSPLVGRTVREAMLRAASGVGVMAVQRRGSHLRSGIADLVLEQGDTVLVQTETARLDELRGTDDFVLLEGLHETLRLRRRSAVVLAILAGVIAFATLDILAIAFLAVGAAGLLVLSGCITMREAYRSLDLSTLALMAGTVALGVALDETKGAEAVAGVLLDAARSVPVEGLQAYVALGACWLLTNALTCVVSNVASATVVLPIALHAASDLGVSDRPFVLAVVYAASLAFATPMGYQTNLLVWGPGGYRFGDFVRAGLPLQILTFGLAMVFLPLMSPF